MAKFFDITVDERFVEKTDCSTALLDASAKANYLGHGRIVVPPGDWPLFSPVNLLPGTMLVGAGSGDTTFSFSGVGPVFVNSENGERVCLTGFHLVNVNGGGTCGVDLSNTAVELVDLTVVDFAVGVSVRKSPHVLFNTVDVRLCDVGVRVVESVVSGAVIETIGI